MLLHPPPFLFPLLANCEQSSEVLRLFNEMRSKELEPDLATQRLALLNCRKLQDQHGLVQLLDEMIIAGQNPGLPGFNAGLDVRPDPPLVEPGSAFSTPHPPPSPPYVMLSLVHAPSRTCSPELIPASSCGCG